MKNLFLSIVLIACFHSGFGQVNTYIAPKINTLPVFDGDTIDNLWTITGWKNIDQPWIPYNNVLSGFDPSGTKTITGASDFSGRYKMTWSVADSLLFFLVEIHDDVFIGGYDPATGGGNYPNYDVVEIFIDEDHSGGNHLFDSGGNNAENAFAYHMNVNAPAVGAITTSLTGAMDLFGTTYSNIVNYKKHFPMYSMKNYGGGRYVYEFALRIYKDTYDNNNPFASRRALHFNDQMGLSVAYCDNDEADNTRNHFIGSVTVSGANSNNSYIDASIFGTLILTGQDDWAPTVPTNLTITNAVLSWSPSTDDVSFAGYNLYQNNVFLTSLTGLTYTLPGYTPPGTPYSYKVQAFDASGNVSDFSDFIVYTPAKPQLTIIAHEDIDGCLSYSGFTLSGINLLDTVYVDARELSGCSLVSTSNNVSGNSVKKVKIQNSILEPVSFSMVCLLRREDCINEVNQKVYITSKFADSIILCYKMCVSGIELGNTSQIKIYPNPVTEVLSIDLQKPAMINITNVLGNTVFSKSLAEGQQAIDISSLKKGYYLINIQQPNQPKLVKPIIKE